MYVLRILRSHVGLIRQLTSLKDVLRAATELHDQVNLLRRLHGEATCSVAFLRIATWYLDSAMGIASDPTDKF